MTSRLEAPQVGAEVAGKWRLDRVLGVGGTGIVFAATHPNGSRVAIKVMRTSLLRDPEMVSRFTREGRAGNLVPHPGVVRVFDEGYLENGAPYLVMELLEGESLDRLVARVGRVPAPRVMHIAWELLDVLAAAHDVGLVHRDIKPENVLVTTSGQVKVLDFGIARDEITSGRTRTVAGAVLGTPAFMPPEQARGRWDLVDGRTDLWAVGATMFVMLTGRLLREGDTVQEELVLATQRLLPVRSMAPSIPPGIAALLDRALAYDKRARFASARQMQLALGSALGQPALPDDAPAGLPRRSARGLFLAALGVPFGGVLALGASAAFREPLPPRPVSLPFSAAAPSFESAPVLPPLLPLVPTVPSSAAVSASGEGMHPPAPLKPPPPRPRDPMLSRF